MENSKIVCVPRELDTLQAEVLLTPPVSKHRLRRLRQDLKKNSQVEITEVGFVNIGESQKVWIYLGVCTCEQYRAFALCAFQQAIEKYLALRCEIDASTTS